MIKGFFYSLKQAFIQVFRNSGMSIASVFSIMAMMLILGVFMFISVNVTVLTETVKDQFGTIEVFLKDDTSEDEAKDMMASLEKMSGVEKISYIDKEQAMEEFKRSWGDNAYLLDGLASNPLPNSIRVDLASLEDGDLVSMTCANFPGVEDVRFYRDEVNKVISIANAVQKGALVIILFLVIVSVVVVSNTVKLTVMARQDEIMIMKYVGATNWFIRGPMLCEGMIIGLISAALGILISAAVYIRINELFSVDIAQLFASTLVSPEFMIVNLTWIFIALGLSIGACGSIISMRRYLRA